MSGNFLRRFWKGDVVKTLGVALGDIVAIMAGKRARIADVFTPHSKEEER
jgi:hypothetical protein